VTKWFVRLVVLVAAFDALGLPAVSDVLRQFLLWLPNLVVGLVVLVSAASPQEGSERRQLSRAVFRCHSSVV